MACEPANVGGYGNSSGLAIALKNSVAQLADLAADFDMAVNEQCHEYSECAGYSALISRGKPVCNVEYASTCRNAASARDAMCPRRQTAWHAHAGTAQ